MIIFDKVSKQFGDGTVGVQDVSFEIKPGEMILITGPSGSGKTTLMKLLTKEYDPTAGEIIFNETPLSSIRPGKIHQHRRNIGVVFQDYKLLRDLNVWENIALALDILGLPQAEIEERVTDLLDLVGLTDKALLFPVQLSGGEAQRVGIARALAPAPKVIFADEPTGNLDAETSATIAALFSKINDMGTTILLSTHDNQILDQFKGRLLHLEKGSLTKDTGSKKSKSKKSESSSTKEADATKEETKENEMSDDHTAEETPKPNRVSRWLKGILPSKKSTPEKPKNSDDPSHEEHESSKKDASKKDKTKKSEKTDKTEKKDEELVTVSVERI